jgi:hypothetical protein
MPRGPPREVPRVLTDPLPSARDPRRRPRIRPWSRRGSGDQRSDEKGRPGPLGARAGLIFCPCRGHTFGGLCVFSGGLCGLDVHSPWCSNVVVDQSSCVVVVPPVCPITTAPPDFRPGLLCPSRAPSAYKPRTEVRGCVRATAPTVHHDTDRPLIPADVPPPRPPPKIPAGSRAWATPRGKTGYAPGDAHPAARSATSHPPGPLRPR